MRRAAMAAAAARLGTIALREMGLPAIRSLLSCTARGCYGEGRPAMCTAAIPAAVESMV